MPDLADDLRSYVDRLAGLAESRAAAPSSPADVPDLPGLPGRGGGRRGRPAPAWWAAGVAAALVLVVVGVVVLDRDSSDEGSDVQAADTTVPPASSSTTTTTATTATTSNAGGTGVPAEAGATGAGPANGMVPGRAVLETQTNAIRTFAPDGTPGDTISPDPQQPWGQPVRSDLAGGWVACGATGTLVWWPAGREPVVLSDTTPACGTEPSHALHVVGSPDGPTAVYESAAGVHAVVLATGQDRAIEIPGVPQIEPGGWSAATGRLLVRYDGRYRLFDIGTGEEIAIASVPAAAGENFVLAPDAATVAVRAVGEEVRILDLASGEERHRVFDPLVFSFHSYDGTTVAVPRIPEGGSFAGAEVLVVDVATGARHTLGVYGVPL